MDDLTRIGIRAGTDKAYYHTFTRFYEPYFSPLREKPLTILEIGICEGASLRMLQSYFPRAEIHAIDVNPTSVRSYGERIHTYLCSQTDTSRLDRLFGALDFDIILDDGSHICSHQQRTLGHLFPRVRPGGLYICEDIHTSFSPDYADTTPTTYELLSSSSFASSFIPAPAQQFLKDHVETIDLYCRSTPPYECWKCRQSPDQCACGHDTSPSERDSQTAVLVRRHL